MLGAEIDFIVLEIDERSYVAIASRVEAMQLRTELYKLKVNDTVKVGILVVGVNQIIVELFGKYVDNDGNNRTI